MKKALMENGNEKIIRKFLLGELPEKERSEFEERFIRDTDLFAQIKVVEDEMIENYVRGWLDPAGILAFEHRFLNSKKRRERVEFSRRFLSTVDAGKAAEEISVKESVDQVTQDVSVWEGISAYLFRPRFVLAGCALLIAGVLGTWMLYPTFNGRVSEVAKSEGNQNLSTPNEVNPQIPSNSEADLTNASRDDSSINGLNAGNKAPVPKVNSERPKKVTPNQDTTPVTAKAPEKTRSVPSPVLSLFAGTVRSSGSTGVLVLPKEAKAAIIVLNYKSADYEKFQAQLTDADGNVIFENNQLRKRKSKISFVVPASKLKSGDYMIRLSGKNASGDFESVTDFQFRVKN